MGGKTIGNKKPYQNLVGNRYGRLTVLSLVESPASANIPTKWLCVCDCGKQTEVQSSNLKSGVTRSCGCLQKELAKERSKKHGMTGTRIYMTWQNIIKRCKSKTDKSYKWYGGRGITICEEWANDFQSFYNWALENGYSDDLTIDRIDVNGNYEPSNCRWVTFKEQQRNKSNNVYIEYNGQIKTLCEWARVLECYPSMVYREILLREGRLYGCEKND
jgi:hypothetical protein